MFEALSGQITANSNEVTLNYSWDYTKAGLNSGLGVIAICSAPLQHNSMICCPLKSKGPLLGSKVVGIWLFPFKEVEKDKAGLPLDG